MKNKIQTLLLTAGVLAFGTAAAEDKVAKPEAVAICATCHGENGVSVAPNFPNLAGQHRSYLEFALRAYKSGARKNPIMGAQVANLSDEDIKHLATWFSQQDAVLHTLDPEAK